MNQCEMVDTAREIAGMIQNAGFRAFFVGGAVRDMLWGGTPHDIDLMTTATPEELKTIFPDLQTVGASFGVSLLCRNGFSFELATAREERNYLDGRHPELVRYTRDPELDVLRRDFTINSLLYDPVVGAVLDFTGGAADLRRGILRTVGDPERRFGEDYLRMLRAVRFSARMRFEIEPATAAAIRALAGKCAEIAPERVRVELTGMLLGPEPARAMELLAELGILRVILPELAVLENIDQPPEFHPEGNVFVHTMLMLRHMAYPDAELAWSVLLHDVGKAPTAARDETGRIRFFGHECVGAEMADAILTRLHFSNRERENIVSAVRRHMYFANVDQMRPATLRKLLGSPTFALELELNRLDCISCHGLLGPYVRLLDEIICREGEIAMPAPLLQGRDLIAAGHRPCPQFGKVLGELYERQLSGEILTRDQALKIAGEALA